ncbi:hypothetical protein ACO9S2_09970 [Nitrospira sp. NS4]|uniref:hypothetical protein n=1 Tax=Nitrospira sp. NS4 TaxID=3414498 RepID=UPI002BF7C3A0|nr:hypothetical protein [Nitrospira sp.]
MTPLSQSHPAPSRSRWHHLFSDAVRWVLAPLILVFSGFFTANFVISVQYTWPRTSRVLALTLTVLILSYEFVYKEQLARGIAPERARTVVLYACVVPYLIGWLLMLALWKL